MPFLLKQHTELDVLQGQQNNCTDRTIFTEQNKSSSEEYFYFRFLVQVNTTFAISSQLMEHEVSQIHLLNVLTPEKSLLGKLEPCARL